MIGSFKVAIEDPALDEWQLHLYGSGALKEALIDLVRQEALEDRVKVMGRTDDVASVLASASINLLTSKFEGFPMSILEAASVGVPTIAFDCSAGVRELIPKGAGVLVAPDDRDAYAAELRRIMSDATARSTLGASALGSVQRFQGPAVAMRWFDLLDECWRQRHPPTFPSSSA